MKELSKAEEMVLLAIWRLGENAYGVPVRAEIKKTTRKNYTYGTLYGLLRQLAHKGYVEKHKGDPLPRKGGRGRTYFRLTVSGIRALKDSWDLHKRMWKDMHKYSFD